MDIIRTIEYAKNPVWKNADRTVLDVDVKFEELPFVVIFTTLDGEGTIHGQELWDRCKAGEFGVIADYKAPEISIEEIVKDAYS